MYSMTPKSTSPIPFVHTHTKALPKSTGGFYYQQAKDSNVDLNASKSQLLLGAEKKLLEHRCEDKIELAKHKAFIAHQAAFIPPRPPTPIQKDDQSVQTENQVVLQRELDSLNDYQSWISGSIDPYLKVSYFIYLLNFFSVYMMNAYRSCEHNC